MDKEKLIKFKFSLVAERANKLRENEELFSSGNIPQHQDNCNYIKGLSFALEKYNNLL